MGSQATLLDVATLAGVSLATASRALDPVKGTRVGSELRARVRAAAAELSYVPNAHAQAMRSPGSGVGLIVHDIGDPVAAALASGVLQAAAAAGVLVTIGATGSDPEAEVRLLEAQRRQRARAVILAGSRFLDSPAQSWLVDEITALQTGGGRVVTIGQSLPPAAAITVDNQGGAAALGHTLWNRGYRSFAVLIGPEYLQVSDERLTGFRSALAEHGCVVPEEFVLSSSLTRDGGYSSMRELLDTDRQPQCVFAVSDSMAMGAVAAIRDSGLQVPADVAVAGFGDIAALRDVVPGLTTVRLPLVRMGELAFRLAFTPLPDAADATRPTDPATRSSHRITGSVVVRASTPPVEPA